MDDIKNIEVKSNPKDNDVEFLTRKIDNEAEKVGITETCGQFSIFVKDDNGEKIAGANGFLIYGSIYTDQLWVREDKRDKGLGRKLMDRVHQYGLDNHCNIATVCTFSFQHAAEFYMKIGYKIDLERPGYVNDSQCIFLSKKLIIAR